MGCFDDDEGFCPNCCQQIAYTNTCCRGSTLIIVGGTGNARASTLIDVSRMWPGVML